MNKAPAMRIIFAVAAAAAAFMGVRSLAPESVPLRPVPRSILGSWVTDDPRYAERGFVIERDTIEFQVGQSAPLRYPVRGVHERQASGHVAYEITYTTDDGDAVLRLLSYRDGVIRLEHPAGPRWVRSEPAG